MTQANEDALIEALRTIFLAPAAPSRLLLDAHKLYLVVVCHCLGDNARSQLPRLLYLPLHSSTVILAVHSFYSLQRCCMLARERIEASLIPHHSHHPRCLHRVPSLHAASRIAGVGAYLRGPKGGLQPFFLAGGDCLDYCFGRGREKDEFGRGRLQRKVLVSRSISECYLGKTAHPLPPPLLPSLSTNCSRSLRLHFLRDRLSPAEQHFLRNLVGSEGWLCLSAFFGLRERSIRWVIDVYFLILR